MTFTFRFMGVIPSGMSFQASAENLCAYATQYKTRTENPTAVLYPLDIAVQMKTGLESGQHLGLTVTEVLLIINPIVIKLFANAMQNLNFSQQKPKEKKKYGVYEELWQIDKVDRDDYRFLRDRKEEGEADVALHEERTEQDQYIASATGDMMIFDVPSVLIVVETGELNRFVPVLLLDASMFGTLKDWSRQLTGQAQLSLEVGYFNARHDVWEPIVEPIDDGKSEAPWQVTVDLTQNTVDMNAWRQSVQNRADQRQRSNSVSSIDSSATQNNEKADNNQEPDVMVPTAGMQVNLRATDALQVTVSKTCVDLLTQVAQDITDAMAHDQELAVSPSSAPFVITNHLGINVTVQPEEPLELHDGSHDPVPLGAGSKLELFVNSKVKKYRKGILHMHTSLQEEHRMSITIGERTISVNLLRGLSCICFSVF